MKGSPSQIQKIKKQGKKIYLLPVILIIFLLALIFVQSYTSEQLETLQTKTVPSSILLREAFYPVIDTNIKAPLISAKSAIIMDTDSQVVLFAKNENLVFPMASTTKLMTAIVALDHYKLDDIITNGEKFYFEDILYAMLLPSANDAALAVSKNYPGEISAFVLAMNNKAKEYNLSNSHFADPSGLDGGNLTTALDLTRLATIVMRDKILAEIVGTPEKDISDITGASTHKLKNLNKLLGQDGINGVKTGFTTEAGEVLVTSREENGHNFIMVVMNSEDRFLDTEKLVNYIRGKVSYLNLGL